jgi:hypothetical protein
MLCPRRAVVSPCPRRVPTVPVVCPANQIVRFHYTKCSVPKGRKIAESKSPAIGGEPCPWGFTTKKRRARRGWKVSRVGGPRKDTVGHGRGVLLGGVSRGLARGGFTTKTRRTRRFFGDGARRLNHEILEIHERGGGTESVGGWWLAGDWVGFGKSYSCSCSIRTW